MNFEEFNSENKIEEDLLESQDTADKRFEDKKEEERFDYTVNYEIEKISLSW